MELCGYCHLSLDLKSVRTIVQQTTSKGKRFESVALMYLTWILFYDKTKLTKNKQFLT